MPRTTLAALPASARPTQMRRFLFATMAAVALMSSLSGCVAPVRERVVVREQVVAAAPVVRTMPAPIREDRGAPPAAGYGWVPGHWKWEGNGWAWVNGRWVAQAVPVMPPVIVEEITVAPSPRHYWVPGHWVWQFNATHAGAWGWVRGSWRIG